MTDKPTAAALEAAEAFNASLKGRVLMSDRTTVVHELALAFDAFAVQPSADEICQQCDPPGCGQECRGGPCYSCSGTGKAKKPSADGLADEIEQYASDPGGTDTIYGHKYYVIPARLHTRILAALRPRQPEYGRIHADGSRSGGQPLEDTRERIKIPLPVGVEDTPEARERGQAYAEGREVSQPADTVCPSCGGQGIDTDTAGVPTQQCLRCGGTGRITPPAT